MLDPAAAALWLELLAALGNHSRLAKNCSLVRAISKTLEASALIAPGSWTPQWKRARDPLVAPAQPQKTKPPCASKSVHQR